MGVHLYTAGTPTSATQTTLASRGGLLINIDSATGDIARTTDGWIEDEKFGFYFDSFTVSCSAEFDTAVTRTGTKTLKLSTTSTAGTAIVMTGDSRATPYAGTRNKLFPIKPSTKYRSSVWVKTTNVVSGSVNFRVWTWDSNYANRVDTFVPNTLSGTNDWTLLTREFTTNANASYGSFELTNQLAGNVSDAWFDINSMTLEEVVEPVAHTFDQTFTTGTASGASTGNIAGTSYMNSQSFTPAISQHSGVVLYKKANTGTPTGNFKVDLRTDNAGSPSNTILATTTISLSEYNLIPVGEFVVNLGASLTIGTKYHYVFTDTVTEASGNAFTLGGHAAGGYAGGDSRYSTNGGTSWLVNGTLDLYFKSFYSPLNTPSPSLVSFTAVGSTDNIDQSQLTNSANYPLGDLSAIYFGQQFLPSKSKLTGVVIQKHTTTGTYTGDITVAIVNNNGGIPGSTVLASYTITNAVWTALVVGTDYVVNLPCNLTVDGSTTYWIRLFSSTSSATDFARIKACNPSGYPNGGIAYGTNGVAYPTTSTNDLYFKTLYYKPTTNFKASQNNQSVSISADEDGFLNGAIINLVTGAYSWNSLIGATGYNTNPYYCDYSRTTGSWNPTTGNRIISSLNNAEWIWKLPAGLTNISLVWASTVSGGSTAEISSSLDNLSYTVGSTGTFSGTVALIDGARYVKIKSQGTNVKLETLTISATYSTTGLSILKNYPTNKDIIKQYSTTLGAATTTATYRATKWGFPAIEYSSTEYQYLDIDTTATGSTVAFSELGTSYTTVADGGSISITSTSTPSIFVRHNITANRLYLSSNDYNSSSDKDGSMRQSVVYEVKPNPQITPGNMNSNIKLFYG